MSGDPPAGDGACPSQGNTPSPASLYAVDDCPDAWKLHTPCPRGYLGWHEWAEKKSKTHKQKRCPTCNLFAIWVPRAKRVPRP